MRIYLLLSKNQLQAQLVTNKAQTQHHLNFPLSETGKQQFQSFLNQHPYPCIVLTNLEEELQHEKLPPLNKNQLSEVLKRKLAQHFPDHPFRLATIKEQQALLIALKQADLIDEWLQIITQQKCFLSALYSISQLEQQLPYIKNAPQLLLLSWQHEVGLRQSYFQNQQLQLSRQNPCFQGQTFVQMVQQKLPRIYFHLNNQKLINPQLPLLIVLCCSQNSYQQLQAQLNDWKNTQYQHINLGDDDDASNFWLAQLTKQQPKQSFSAKHYIQQHKKYQQQNLLYYASWALCLLLILSVGLLYKTLKQKQQLIDQFTVQSISTPHAETDTKIKPQDMAQLIKTEQILQKYYITPQRVLFPLSQALNQFPQIELQKLSWQSALPPTNPSYQLILHAQLNQFNTQFRAAENYLQQFQQQLEAQHFQVKVLRSPFQTLNQFSATQTPAGLSFSLQLSAEI